MITSILQSINDPANSILIAWLAGVLWISWLVAIGILLTKTQCNLLVLPYRKQLLVPVACLIIWHIFIMISFGAAPIIDRGDYSGLIRLIDFVAILWLWGWLLVVIKHKIIIVD